MKLRKLVFVEIILLVMAMLLILASMEIAPFLKSSKLKSSIGLYQEREYARGNVTLEVGGRSSVRFIYTSYDPAILIVDITFLTWKTTGYLTLRCNNRVFASVFAEPENSQLSVIVVSVSGREWVEPPSSMFGINEITFESESVDGYEGTLIYKISIRGSR